MKIKLTSSMYIMGIGSLAFGEEVELNEELSKSLIKNGRAVQIMEDENPKPKTVKKKTKKEADK